jgi:hypothetical protein
MRGLNLGIRIMKFTNPEPAPFFIGVCRFAFLDTQVAGVQNS